MRTLVYLALLVFVLGCTGAPPEVDCNKILDTKASQECVMNQSLAKLDASKCDDILDDEVKTQCIDQIAVKVLEYYPCKFQNTRPKQDACESKVGKARREARDNK